jgi:hypothetical protein
MARYLHVANGTSTTSTIHDAGIPGATSIWADPLHEGPVPEVPDEELLRIRAAYLADEGHALEALVAEMLHWREVLDDVDAYDQLVLWYEHDLFDQLNLIQVLDRLAARQPWPKPVSLISIGSFPGRPRFKGLGELTARELGPLFGARQPVTAAQLALGSHAWGAFRSADPRAIEVLLDTDTSALPYLATALERHLEEFPATTDGLSRTERRLLELASPGPIDLRAAFEYMHAEETAFYIADLSFAHTVRDLSAPPVPLIEIRGRLGQGRASLAGAVELTPTGREVLAGRADRVAECGLERWLGGVHLAAPGPLWRWDRAHERIVHS